MSETAYLPRNLTSQILNWLERPEVIAIKGPRRAGKTTLLKIIRQELINRGTNPDTITTLNFEDRSLMGRFETNPVEFVRSYVSSEAVSKHYLFLDEYQYVREGGQKLKLIYDTHVPKLKLIITGSSSLELTSEVGKFMVGRMLSAYLFPFTFDEFLQARDERLRRVFEEKNQLLQRFLFDAVPIEEVKKEDIFLQEFAPHWGEYTAFGGYPAVVTEPQKELKQTLLNNLSNTYIERDIISLLGEESITEFRYLTRLLAIQTGQLLNYQQLANDTSLYYRKVKHFLSVLQETFLIKQLLPLHGNLSTELRRNPKIYFLDSGLRNSLVNNFAEVDDRTDKGALVESVALANVLYNLRPNAEILYWRTSGGAEVDFIVREGAKLFPIEVKYRTMTQPTVSRSLCSFIKAYKPQNVLVLTRDFWGKRTTNNTSILFAPVWYFGG